MARAVRTAADLGASVINISAVACTPAGATLDDGALGAALSYAVDIKNVVVVAAAGNTGAGQCPPQQADATWESATVVVSPAWYDDYVLTVGSVNARGEPSSFSLAGPWVDVAAPGEGVISLSSSGDGLANALVAKQGSTPLSGTSYAAPVVSGLAALVRSRFPTWTARQVMQRIKATAHHPAGGSDPRVGAGVVDFLAAVSTDSPTVQAPSATRSRRPSPSPCFPRRRITAHATRLSRAPRVCGGLLAVTLCVRAIRTRLPRTAPRQPEHPERLRHWSDSTQVRQAVRPTPTTARRPSRPAGRGRGPHRRHERRTGRRCPRSGSGCPRERWRPTGWWRVHKLCVPAVDRPRRRQAPHRQPAPTEQAPSRPK